MALKVEQLKWDIVCTGNQITIPETHVEIKELYGGFGQGQRILTVPQIAQLHCDNPYDKTEVKKKIGRINDLINNNLILDNGEMYFEFGIDILDLKQNGENGLFSNLKKQGIYTQAQIGNAKNLYILSEQGYSLLINLMSDMKSKIMHKRVIRDYFNIKKLLLTSEDTAQQMARLLGKKERKKTTDTIKHFIESGELYHNPSNPKMNAYAKETNYIYKTLFGMTAKEIEEYLELEIKDYDTVRNYLCYEDVDMIRDVEGRVGYMMQDGKTYAEIKARLKELYPSPIKPKLADKSIPMIKRLLLME